ncbi:hypothetical protein BDA96_10G167500 [Sorghum bicolor]|uniref:Uncharacterized protein n=2 Tax=Sorghum bicolor TaxID=4558 RepID=A0A1W0VSV1_SORBI|nr:hypothetical protein BDA96_10G167500 [Sorghum bicolor]OQU76345.1 hypothetical protein SORBI_3010G133450 [Sorghum bicolor]
MDPQGRGSLADLSMDLQGDSKVLGLWSLASIFYMWDIWNQLYYIH